MQNINDNPTISEIDSIVISGGGIHGIMVLGALQHAMDDNVVNLSNIDMFVGTSIGSIICYMLILGIYPTEIIYRIIQNKSSLSDVSIVNIQKFINMEGAISFTPIQNILEHVTLEKTGTLFTMKSLYERYKKKLVCVTYNYSLKKIEYLSYENYPDLPCILACSMSSAIPAIFNKCIYNDNYYIDGGIHDNFAIDFPIHNGKKYPIGFNIEYQYKDFEKYEKFHIYLYELYKIAINACAMNKCKIFENNAKIIKIVPDSMNPLWSVDYDIINILDMFSKGYVQYTDNG